MAKKTKDQTTKTESSRRKPPDPGSGVKARKSGAMVAKKGGGKARSAITGRYVKKSYAKKHSKTTVIERSKKSGSKKSRKK